MFRDDRQRALACRALLASVRLGRLWTEDGPSDEALGLLDSNGGPLSSGERIMLLSAFAFWNGSGGLTLTEILDSLDAKRAEALASLVVSANRGAGAVDAWLAEHEET